MVTNNVLKRGSIALISGLGGALAIWILAGLTQATELMLLIAPFGASCVLVFALPEAPVAQPKNVIVGHFLSALVGLLTLSVLGNSILAMGIGVGLAIAVMQISRSIHPPAGGNPLLVMAIGAGWQFLVLPILVGSILLVCMGLLYHKLVSKRAYPA
ncbi:MAG: HPP family protein [Alcaligenes sp.]